MVASKFRKDFLQVASANAISQLILVASMPALARVYTPEAFGLAGIFTAAMQLLASGATLKYERLLPNCRSNSGATAIFMSAALCLSISVTILLAVLIFDAPIVSLWKGSKDLGTSIDWLPLALLAICGHQILSACHVRDNRIKPVSLARIAQSTSYVLIAFAAIFFGQNQEGLILATTFSWVASAFMLGGAINHARSGIRRVSILRLRAVIVNKAGEATSVALVSFVNTVSIVAPIFLLSQAYSAKDIGYYALVMRLIGTPLTIITSALAVTFWSRSAELVRARDYASLQRTYLRTTTLLLIPASAVTLICLLSPHLIQPVLGERWTEAGPVLRALTPFLVGVALFSPTNHLFVLGVPLLQLIADGSRLMLMGLSIWAASTLDLTFPQAVAAMAFSSLIGHLILFALQVFTHRKITPKKTAS